MTDRIAQLATLFGIGRVPYTPGTAASLAATVVAIPVAWLAGPLALFALSIAAAVAGVWIAGEYAIKTGRNDPSECVIDELAGQWLTCAFAPLSPAGFVLAFLLFRLFDMAKPWPVSAAERLEGGLGIVADDMAAGLMAGIIVMLVWRSGFL